ncbi:MAG TPA: transporter substrate-binding domain-containing protein [Accumulibacter sp.]|uniref:PAS domain-containing protein n=1 Tax=Accumulibacter sp. TaxID=2053492 RepID=UPI002C2F8ED4|nr:transporter substrate-binding domain-containing protein [Accumulibacter sp.]HRF72093.1 transporter substrate-binding domain-containing protein [Accumulibacter sp.]
MHAFSPSLVSLTVRILLGILLCLVGAVSASEPATGLALSPQQTRWLSRHRVIRMGFDPHYAPYSFVDAQGRVQGVAADLVARLAVQLGVRIEAVTDLSWPQLMAAVQAHEIDALATVVRLPEREAFLEFTRIYIPTPLVIMTRDDAPKLLSAADLAPLKVALVKEYSSSQQVMARFPSLRPLFVATPLEGLQAVASGLADAYVGVLGINTYQASRNGISNLKVNAAFEMRDNGQRIAVRGDWPELAALFDQALNVLPEADKAAIFARWIPVGAPIDAFHTPLSDDEATWLASHKRLRVGVARALEPFSFIDPGGRHAGLAAEYLQRLSDQTGVELEEVVADSLDELDALLRDGRVDLVSVSARAAADEMRLTTPFHRASLMVFSLAGVSLGGEPAELAGRSVGVLAGGVAQARLGAETTLKIVPYPSVAAALLALDQRRVDLVVADAASAFGVLESLGLPKVHANPPLAGMETPLRFAVRADWPELAAILDRTLGTVAPAERSLMLSKWLHMPSPGLPQATVFKWAGGAAAVVVLASGLLLLWNRQLAQEVVRRQRGLRASETRLRVAEAISHVGNWQYVVDQDQLSWSDEVYRIFGLPAGQRVSLGGAEARVHPDDRERYARFLKKLLDSRPDEEVAGIEYRILRPDGVERHVTVWPRAEHAPDGRATRLFGTVQDVTERKARESELLRLQVMLHALVEGASDSIFVKDRSGHYLVANSALAALLQRPLAEIIGRTDFDLFPQQLAERFRRDDARTMASRMTGVYDEPVIGAAGEFIYQTTKGPLLIGDRVEGVFGIARDISERERTEATLREREARLNEAQAIALLGSWEIDLASGVCEWSAEMFRLTGFDPAQAPPNAERAIEWVHPDDRAAVLAMLAEATAGGAPERVLLRRHPERGPLAYFVGGVRAIRDVHGKVVRLSGTIQDVTEQRQVTEALREAQQRLQRALDNIPDAVVLYDRALRIQYINNATTAITGRLPGEFVGYRDDQVWPAEVCGAWLPALEACRASGTNQSVDVELRLGDREPRSLSIVCVPLPQEDGTVREILGITHDFTEIRRAERRVRELNVDLERRVAERTAELSRALKELETFSYSVSHDLKAPLRGIDGYSQLLLEDHADQLNDEGRQFLNNVRRGVEQMNQLIADLLAYSRIERQSLQTRPVQLVALLDEVSGERHDDPEAVQLQIRVDPPGLAPRADPDGLRLVLRNLLDNAIKFSLDARPAVIRISCTRNGNAVEIEIADNGIGFDMRFHNRIFDIFQRLQRAEDYPGTGIGLAIVRKALDRMGGSIRAESEAGKGARFRVTLPVAS